MPNNAQSHTLNYSLKVFQCTLKIRARQAFSRINDADSAHLVQKVGLFGSKIPLFPRIPQIIGPIPIKVTIGFQIRPVWGLRPPGLPTGIDSLVASRHQRKVSKAQTKPTQNQAIWQLASAPGKQAARAGTAKSGSGTA
ncbi:unannotated protein [freshwater metagenome]|uniref:Unannotated protein n=1 Tax=freshwater metagenome TaxID=449393 RepID=A0A6J6JQH9_9ZZZZ